MFFILPIALSLSIDSFSVAVALGINYKKSTWNDALKIGFFFGLFQALMPIFGWLIGYGFTQFISSFDHWLAFFILCLIGLRMIFFHNKERKDHTLGIKKIIILSIVTSIDALVLGISFNVLKISLFLLIPIIGIVTFILSGLGFYFGKKLCCRLDKLNIFAGLILIFIGLKFLLEHLI